jgi:glycyl-tRNA synthetase beta chain
VSILEKVPADRLHGEIDAERLVEEPERALWKGQLDVRRRVDARLERADYQGALEDMATLKPAIDQFFDKVHVMAEDIVVRENRFRLLLALRTLFGEVADLSQIQGAEKP